MTHWTTPQYLMIAYWLIIFLANLRQNSMIIDGQSYGWVFMATTQAALIGVQVAILYSGGFF